MAFLGPGHHRRRNAFSRVAHCTRCGAAGELASFDALRTFDVLFLPLLPLGRVRVSDLCSRCGHHERSGQRQWEKLRDAAKSKAVDFFRSGLSPEESEELLQLVRKFDLRQSYEAMASLAEQRAENNGVAWRVLAELARHFGDEERAERALSKARELGLPDFGSLPKVATAAAKALPAKVAAKKAGAARVPPSYYRFVVLAIALAPIFAFVSVTVLRRASSSNVEGIATSVPSPAAGELPAGFSPIDWADYLLDTEGSEAAHDWALEYLASHPSGDEVALPLYERVMSKEEFATFAAAQLAERPLLIEWHRSYQNIAQRQAGDAEAVLSQYRARLAEHPEDSGLYYLTARLLSGERAQELLQEGLAQEPVSPWVYHAIGWRALTAGQFEEALENAGKARRLDDKVMPFRYAESEAQVALGIYAEAFLRGPKRDLSESMALMLRFWHQEEIDRFFKDALRQAPPEQRPQLRNFYDSEVCAHQDLACYRQQLAHVDLVAARLRVALIDRDAEAAEELVGESRDLRSLLLMALVFSDHPIGERWRGKAATSLGRGGTLETRALSLALDGLTYDTQAVYDSTLEPRLKTLALTIVGKRHGHPEMLELARRLNYYPGFFRLLVKRELG